MMIYFLDVLGISGFENGAYRLPQLPAAEVSAGRPDCSPAVRASSCSLAVSHTNPPRCPKRTGIELFGNGVTERVGQKPENGCWQG
jgi:hypothetical protein